MSITENLMPETTANDSIVVGDTVVCMDASASFHRLALGAQYVVSAAYDGSPVVIASGAAHSIDRFAKK